MEYRLEGSGPTVMVLNGGHCSRDTRLSHERLAAHGFSVLTPSRPGYDSTPDATGKSAQEAAGALASLLDILQVDRASVIGISAAGPTALAFAAHYPNRIRSLILESAVAVSWGEAIKRQSRLGFGVAGPLTWGLLKLMLRLMPAPVMRLMVGALTTLDVREVMNRMSPDDLQFVRRMLETSQAGSGFVNDIEHRVDDLTGITAPTLVMYSPHDKAVPTINARRLSAEVALCELYEVPCDTHLIWIGKTANDVWEKRLSFLRSKWS
jgi:pimeloyl-ACP methyl ester carboxylesterase